MAKVPLSVPPVTVGFEAAFVVTVGADAQVDVIPEKILELGDPLGCTAVIR
jgi:hypothetical protein